MRGGKGKLASRALRLGIRGFGRSREEEGGSVKVAGRLRRVPEREGMRSAAIGRFREYRGVRNFERDLPFSNEELNEILFESGRQDGLSGVEGIEGDRDRTSTCSS